MLSILLGLQEEIAARLGDCLGLLTQGNRGALPRQQTLAATIGWSYDLLTPPERALFRLLSVFAGGWTLPAAQWVYARAGFAPLDVATLLDRLHARSLVLPETRNGEPRYRMLEPVRQYARARLHAFA